MNKNLILNNLSIEYNYDMLIISGLILGCTISYVIWSKNVANLPNNTEALANQEIEAIINENMVPVTNANVEDLITDSDFETDTEYDNISELEIARIADLGAELYDLYFLPAFDSKFRTVEFIMPDVDLNVCSIHELKHFEFCSLFSKEMAEHSLTEEDMIEIIGLFSKEDLATNWINDLILAVVKLL